MDTFASLPRRLKWAEYLVRTAARYRLAEIFLAYIREYLKLVEYLQ